MEALRASEAFSLQLRKCCMAREMSGASRSNGLIATCVFRCYGWRLAMNSDVIGSLESKDKALMAVVWKGWELK